MSRPKPSEHEISRDGERASAPLVRIEPKPKLRVAPAEAAASERPRNVGGRLMV